MSIRPGFKSGRTVHLYADVFGAKSYCGLMDTGRHAGFNLGDWPKETHGDARCPICLTKALEEAKRIET